MASLRKNQTLCYDPLLAEAIEALIAINFGIELGMRKVILECDSKILVSDVQTQKEDDNNYGMTISEIRSRINCFDACVVKHVYREQM